MMIRTGVIGYGYWGPNIVRNLAEIPEMELRWVSDLRSDRLRLVSARYPGVRVTNDYREVCADPQVDAVVIAAPVSTHFPLAMAALGAGKHVLVEKPLAATVEEAQKLVDEARRRGLTLMVDHTFVYTGAVRKIKQLIEDLGELYYYDSVRVNLGLFQRDVNVIWDLAVHDFAIMDYTLGVEPTAITATGMSHVEGTSEDIAYITVFYPGELIAHVNVNWLSPLKVRRVLIGGSRRMMVYDDLETSEKLKIYDKGITVTNGNGPDTVYKLLVNYRTGDMWAPKLDVTEALNVMLRHFAECIETGRRPITDGVCGLKVVRMLEAATESAKQRGRLIEFPSAAAVSAEAV
ncbi:MAG TPA: Gfo/Idh/MocA family oxidoreductase [Bryobacteraceae bacterium]|nr:Gfo/Idh/MocA family oxidoreductase [Bryobacteraceae bacterium]